jgi:hypothetical protein
VFGFVPATAFLLAGSNDLAMAAAAEEAAREACRHSAKAIFAGRRRGPDEEGEDKDEEVAQNREGPSENTHCDNLPRSWLVGSYFAAYEPLSAALSLYTPTGGSEQPAAEGTAAVEAEVEVSDNLCDIDEDDRTQCALPSVPAHLLDASGPRNRDAEGYALLLCLVEALEAVTYDSALNAESSRVTADAIAAHFQATSAARADEGDNDKTHGDEAALISELAVVVHRGIEYTDASTGSKRTVRGVAASLLSFAEQGGAAVLAKAMAEVTVKSGSQSQKPGSEVEGELHLLDEGSCTVPDSA